MKKIVLFSLLMVCLPFMALAQSGNDDLYYIPKKKKTEKVQAKTVVKTEQTSVMGNGTQVTAPVVIRDVNGNTRDLDEYNRRYSSRENEFTYENDTLYIQEKPYLEQGEWVNGFQGSQEDYDYAMRIIRFRSPSFAVSVSSPYYWDIISLGYSSNWNVFDTGMYAFAFPTLTNSWWWDWRYSSMFSIRYHPSNWLYRPYWYYASDWYYGWGYHYPPHIHHSHWHNFPPHYAHGGVGGYWGNNHGWYGSSAHNPGIHAGRYTDNYNRVGSLSGRNQGIHSGQASRNESVGNRRPSRNDQTVNRSSANAVRSSSARVVTSRNSTSSIRPQRSATKSSEGQAVSSGSNGGTRSTGVYTRSAQGKNSSYNRASSTRSTVSGSGSWNGNGSYGASHSSGSSSSGGSRSSSVSSGSSRSSSSGSYSSGGSGGGRSASSGGASRGSGGRR